MLKLPAVSKIFTLNVVKILGFRLFFLFSYVNCVCEQRFELMSQWERIKLQLKNTVTAHFGGLA